MASAGKQPVMLWDLDTRDQVGLLPGPGAMLKNLVFSGDGQKLFAVEDKDRMIVWSAPITKP
jgi:WD40 repeat protein